MSTERADLPFHPTPSTILARGPAGAWHPRPKSTTNCSNVPWEHNTIRLRPWFLFYWWGSSLGSSGGSLVKGAAGVGVGRLRLGRLSVLLVRFCFVAWCYYRGKVMLGRWETIRQKCGHRNYFMHFHPKFIVGGKNSKENNGRHLHRIDSPLSTM